MKTQAAISIILCALTSGGAGYLFRAQKTDGSVILSSKDVVQADYLVPPDSFSRVNNTKNALQGLSARLDAGIVDAVWAYDRLPKSSASEKRRAEQVLDRAIHSGVAVVHEFEGTAQQPVVAQGLLLALKKAGRFDRWTEVYLEMLFKHPTDPVVSRLADEALKISRRAGQEHRVLEALTYLSAFPAKFAGKPAIQAALEAAYPCFSQLRISRQPSGAGDPTASW
jgi:hypothetical protein